MARKKEIVAIFLRILLEKRVNGIKEQQMPFIRILNILNNMIQSMF